MEDIRVESFESAWSQMISVKSGRILIVDDDADNLANLSDILSEHGYQTETACDGQVALEKVANDHLPENSPFDLCLLDFKMPGMDGAELLEKIHSTSPDLPAIMITAYAGDDGVQRAFAAGSWKVLSKPVDIQSLLTMIEQAIAG